MASITEKNSKKKKKGKIVKQRKSIKEEKLELYLLLSVKVVLQKRGSTKSKNFMVEELNFILGFSLKTFVPDRPCQLNATATNQFLSGAPI